MLSKIDEYKTGSEVASSVNILIAIRGIAHRVRIKFKKRQFESVSKKVALHVMTELLLHVLKTMIFLQTLTSKQMSMKKLKLW